ncbi:MAG: HEAT repeat domain-containing protein [Candidatus Krumholzibacteriia bacterium]
MIAFQTFVLYLGLMLAVMGFRQGTSADASDSPVATVSDLVKVCADVGSGSLAFHFPVRDGVTGNGRGVRIRWNDQNHSWFRGWYDDSDPMEDGPGWMALQLEAGSITEASVVVGRDGPRLPPGTVDLGALDPGPVAAFCLEMIPGTAAEVAEDLLLAGIIARGADVAGPLLALARNGSIDAEVRCETTMWLAALAGEKVAGHLTAIARDRSEEFEVREHAVFALSQLPGDCGRPLLLEIARKSTEPRLQQVALFALTEYEGDPEVLALLEDILTGD